MSDVATEFLPTLGHTTLGLILAGITTAAILRLAHANWPTAHRVGWVVTLLVGWTFLRLPVAIPWYDAAPSDAGMIAQVIDLPRPTISPFPIPSPLVGEGGDGHRREALVGEPGEGAQASANSAAPSDVSPSPTDLSPGKAFPGLMDFKEILNPSADWPLAALFVWALGIAGLAAAWLIGYRRFVRSLPSSLAADPAWLDQWSKLLVASGVRRSIPLRVTADLGPMLCRLPRGYELLVPAALWEELEIGQRGAILRHELAHYLRGDVWKSLAIRVLALPHWFNPVSWWAVRRFEEAAEWACDRAATAEAPPTTYAKALIRLGAAAAGPAAYGSAARGPALAVRIRRLIAPHAKEDSKMKKTLLVATGLCLAALSMVRLQLVAKEPDAGEEPKVETVELNGTDNDENQAAPPVSTEPAKPAVPSLEMMQLKKKLVAEHLADLMSNRSRIVNDLSRVKLQIMLAEARKAKPGDLRPPDAAIEYQLSQHPEIVQARQKLGQYYEQLADEETKINRRDDPRLKTLRAKIQKLEQSIEDRKAALRPQLKEQLAADATKDGPATTLPLLEKEKEYLEDSLEEMEKGIDALAKNLQNLEKFSAEVARQRDQSAQGVEIAAEPARAEPAKAASAVQPAKTSDVSAASQKMVEQAEAAYQAANTAFKNGQGRLEPVYSWSERWMTAANHARKGAQERTAAVHSHLERMAELQRVVKRLNEAGQESGDALSLAAANFYVTEAERLLAQVTGRDAAAGIKDAEIQSLDLQIKIADIQGQLEATKAQLAAINAAWADKKRSADERNRLQGERLKLDTQQKSLATQLKELNSRNFDFYVGPVALAARTPTQLAKDKQGLRYNGKNFDAWAEELRDDLSPERRREAIQALATFGAHGYGPQAAAQIIEAMRGYSVWMIDGTEEGRLKSAALEAFKKIPRGDALPLVMEALKSDSANERLFAVAVLPDVVAQPRDIVPILSEMLKDPDGQVRRYAVGILVKIDHKLPELVPVLRETLGSEDRKLVGWAISIAGGSRTGIGIEPQKMLPSIPLLIPEIVGLLNSADDQIRTAARKALIDFGPEAIGALTTVLQSTNDEEIAARAEETLQSIRQRQAK